MSRKQIIFCLVILCLVTLQLGYRSPASAIAATHTITAPMTSNTGLGVSITSTGNVQVNDSSEPPFYYYISFGPRWFDTSSAGGGVSFYDSVNTSGLVQVWPGGSASCSISASSGHRIADVLVDGVSVGPVSQYTFINVMANHSINAYFTPIYCIVTATAGPHGTISPSGQVSVPLDGDQAFTITPDPGYVTAELLVDGRSEGEFPSNVYRFRPEMQETNHTITASFVQSGYTIAASAGANGVISPSGNTTWGYRWDPGLHHNTRGQLSSG